MSLPKPPASLDGSCSVIYNNILYSYSPNGFLSVNLDGGGGQWTELAMGEKVTGATCTGSTPADATKAAFFVVGGTADTPDYPGLQKFTYSTGEWTTIHAPELVTQNRLGHDSIYMENYDAILVYAGNQDGSQGPSSQTFTINASEPYDVGKFQSDSPVSLPILLDWSSDDAAVLSGDATSGEIYWFNPVKGWRQSGASLARPVDKADGWMDAILTTGTDGSKNIYIFDLSQSPNQVTRAVVQDASGNPIANAPAVTKRGPSEVETPLNQRDLTLGNWPEYNSTLAPVGIRKFFTVAQNPAGLAVISGGTATDTVEMFDTTGNQWLNATGVLLAPQGKMAAQEVLANGLATSSTGSATSTATGATSTNTGATTTISSTSATSTSSASSTTATPTTTSRPATTHSPAAITSTPTDLVVAPMDTADGDDSGMTPNQILGITLGVIGGILALLGLIVFILSLRRRRRLKKGSLRNRRIGSPMAIEKNEELPSNPDRPPPPSHYRPTHQHQASQDSSSSEAMLLGGAPQTSAATAGTRAPRSVSPIGPKVTKGAISKPITQVQAHPLVQVEDEQGIVSKPATARDSAHDRFQNPLSAHPPPGGPGDGTRRSSGWNGYWSGSSTVSILGAGASPRDTQSSEGVSSRSSRMQGSRSDLHDSAKVPPLVVHGPRVTSKSPVVSTHLKSVAWKDGLSVSVENRPYSAVSSMYSSGIPESVHEAWDPSLPKKAWGADRAPSAAYAKASLAAPTTGISKQPQLAKAATSADMSWLNLGEARKI